MTDLNANERLDVIAGRLMGEAFCADWHDDPDNGVRECMRIKAFFIERINEFVCDEIKRTQPQYLSNCLRAGACHGKCESTACTNYGKDIVVRRCVETKETM